jgi:hypothetical protein
LDVRSPLIWGAAPAGLVAGALAWLVFGGAFSVSPELTGYETRLNALDTHPARHIAGVSVSVADALAHPLFSVGGVALADVNIQLEGIALTPRRAAALLSINGQPAEWVERGVTKDGATLQQVLSTKVVIDTATGPHEVGLNDHPAPPTQASSAVGGAQQSAVPPGYRLPPPPASAPLPQR